MEAESFFGKLAQAQNHLLAADEHTSLALDIISEVLESPKQNHPQSSRPLAPTRPVRQFAHPRATKPASPRPRAESWRSPARRAARRDAHAVSIQWDSDWEHARVKIDQAEDVSLSFRRSLVLEVLVLAADDAAREGTTPWRTPEQIAMQLKPLLGTVLGRHVIAGTIHRVRQDLQNEFYIESIRHLSLYRFCLSAQGKVTVQRPLTPPPPPAANVLTSLA